MKRIVGAILAMLILIGGFITAMPFLVSSETVRQRIVTKLEEITGREVSFQGDPTVSFSPFLGIELPNLLLSDPKASPGEPSLVSVERVQTQLDLLPALMGDIVITRYRLIRPSISLKVYGDGFENWNFDQGLLRKAVESNRDETTEPVHARLGTFEIEDGKIIYEDVISGIKEEITSANARFDWPDTGKPATLDGSAIWRGENVSFKGSANKAIQLLAGGSSDVTMDIETAPLVVKFSGEANMISDLFIRGRIIASSPSIDRLSTFVDINIGNPGLSGQWEIEGNVEGTTRTAKVTEARVKAANLSAGGVVSFTIDETDQAKIDGTLAFDTIDLSPLLATNATEENTVEENDKPGDVDFDLRVSANRLIISGLELTSMAAAVTMKDGNWVFDIGHSEGFGGTLIAKLGERTENGKNHSFLEITARGIDAAEISALLPDKQLGLSGRADINANLRSRSHESGFGDKSLNGTVDANLKNGEITGIDLKNLLHSTPPEGNTDLPKQLETGGSSPFEELTIVSFVNHGVVSIAKSQIRNGDLMIQLLGNINFIDNGLALRAQEINENGPMPDRLFIGGTMANPLVSVQNGPVSTEEPKKLDEQSLPVPKSGDTLLKTEVPAGNSISN